MPPTSAPASVSDSASSETPKPSTPSSFPFATSRQHDALKQLTSVLTRHLGTLTSTISGYADLLVDAPDAQAQREMAMNVLEASSRIEDLLADLRHYSRSLDPAFRSVPVADVVRTTTDLLDKGDRARVRTKVEPDATGELEADPRLLRQALLNLLQNALEATAPTETVLLRVAAVAADAEATVDFEVWNDGDIELETPTDVFQPFFSVHPQRLGLGLPIASQIARQHDGKLQLTAAGAEEGGTCFTLRI